MTADKAWAFVMPARIAAIAALPIPIFLPADIFRPAVASSPIRPSLGPRDRRVKAAIRRGEVAPGNAPAIVRCSRPPGRRRGAKFRGRPARARYGRAVGTELGRRA